MFHLFRKVYLDIDSNIDAYMQRIIISGTNGYQDGADKTKYAVLEVSELIGEGKEFTTELDLFKKCKELTDGADDKLVIYCDRLTFTHLFIAWHKTLLANIDVDSLWKVFAYHMDKQSYYSAVTTRSENVGFDLLKPSSWDKDVFTSQFSSINATPDTTWNNSIVNDVSIDYLLATHIKSSTDAVKTALKNKMKVLAERTIQEEIYDIKLYAAVRSQDKKLHDILSVSGVNSIAEFFALPSLTPLSDSNYWNENEKMTASNSSTAISLSNVSDIPALITALKLFRVQQQGQTEDSIFVTKLDWLSWITGTFTDEALDNLLTDNNFCAAELTTDSDWHKVNILFVDSVLKLYNTNNTDYLLKYTIAL